MTSVLDHFFNPKSVAVIGASTKEGSVGYVIVKQLKSRYRGKIYPVNPKADKILQEKGVKPQKREYLYPQGMQAGWENHVSQEYNKRAHTTGCSAETYTLSLP